ncbi:MAG: TolC family protein [Acidobacteriota bacterium]
MRWRSRWSLFLLMLGGPANLMGQQEAMIPGDALSLQEAAETALATNPLMASFQHARTAAGAQLDEARAGRLPSLQFSETFTNSNNPVFVFGSLLEQGRFGPQNFALDSLNAPGSLSNFRSALSLRLPVFNRSQISGRIAQAEIGEQVADTLAEMTRQQLRFGVVQAYFGVQVAEARKQVSDEAVTSTQAEVDRLRNLFEQGKVVAAELLAMEVQLADFRQQQIQAAGDVLTAYAALNTVLAQPLLTRPELTVQLTDRTFRLPALNELIEQALASRPEYRQAVLETERSRQDLRMARGQYLPDLNLFASFGQSSRDLTGGSADYAVGAGLTFSLLDFGRGARVRQAVAQARAADAQLRRQADQIRLEVVRAYQSFLAAQERVRVAAGAVEQAAESLRIAQDRHGVGLTTVTEVLRAQTAVVKSRMNLLGARYDYYLGYAQSLLAAGRLSDVNAFVN